MDPELPPGDLEEAQVSQGSCGLSFESFTVNRPRRLHFKEYGRAPTGLCVTCCLLSSALLGTASSPQLWDLQVTSGIKDRGECPKKRG